MKGNNYIINNPFQLESGEELHKVQVRYHTYGQLNDEKNNVIWICHALTANAAIDDWWSGLFGAGNIFDPEKYFIVCANNLGSPYGTTCPDDINPKTNERYGMSFPEFTLKDTANITISLIEHLGINDIQLLMGGSCGGNIALEMAISLKGRVRNMVLLCCSAFEKPWTIAMHHSQRIALEADADFHLNKSNAGLKGLKAARAFALPMYRTFQSINSRQEETDPNKVSDFKSSSYVAYQGDKFTQRFDAHCYYKLLNALDTHNLGRKQTSITSALMQIVSNTLVIGIDSDLFIPTVEQRFLAENIINAEYAEIKSRFGHDAFLIETEQIRSLIRSSNSIELEANSHSKQI